MIVVALTTTAVAITVVAGIALSAAVSRNQAKGERKLLKGYVTEGAIELATSDVASGVLALGQSKNYTIGGITVTVTANDNSGIIPGTAILSVDGTSPSMPIKSTKTVAYIPRLVSNIWSYGIYSNGGFTFPLLGTSKVVGSTYFRNSISILGTGQITKDYKSTASFNPLGLLNIGGAILTGVTALTFPSLTNATYQSAATTVLTGDQVLNGYTFPSEGALVYINGNLTLHGSINKLGTFYVTGSVKIDGNLSTNKQLAIITPGNLTFDSSGTAITAEGYFFSRGTVYLTDKLTLDGALVGNAYSVASNFTVTWDQWATQAAANGESLKLPMMWP